MTEQGTKIRAGMLLSKYIRSIAQEATELVVDPDSGEDRMATKAEALARIIWQGALGTRVKILDKTGKPVDVDLLPDKGMIQLIYDRVEGKAVAGVDFGKKKQSVADKVSEEGKRRIEETVNV